MTKIWMAAAAMAVAGGAAQAQDTFISIGTGGVTGVYYPRVARSAAW